MILPAYAEMIEQTAEARHRFAIAETEAQANQRHEAITAEYTFPDGHTERDYW